MSPQGNTTHPRRTDEGPDLRLIIGAVEKTALYEEGAALPLWMAVALDGDGCPAALGLYKEKPTIGEVMSLLGDEAVVDHGLGPQWTSPGAAAVIVDDAVLWQADVMREWLAERGTAVFALATAGHDRKRVDDHFVGLMKSLAAALKRDAHGRDSKGAALVTPHAAAAAARRWRAAREAAEAGDLAG